MANKMNTVVERIPALIVCLSSVDVKYHSDKMYIGEAITMIRLLKDIIASEQTQD